MKRREFFAAGCLASMAPLAATQKASAASDPSGKGILELRHYLIESPAKQKAMIDFLGKAAIPAWNRLGIAPVGVFTLNAADNEKLEMTEDSPNLYVLMQHADPETVATSAALLAEDKEFLKAGAAVLDAPKKDPAYLRIESSLMLGFDACPNIEIPTKKKTRVFQLRIYESHSLKKGQKKIEMFNTGGEIDVFRKCGMDPVFFGETLVGDKVPNLTYMLGFDDTESGTAAWDKFKVHPGWLALRTNPIYKDTVSNITNLFLRPADCSQI